MYIVFSRSHNKDAAREFSQQNIESCKHRARALELSLIRDFLSLFVQRDSYRFNFPSVLYVNILREITIPCKIISSSEKRTKIARYIFGDSYRHVASDTEDKPRFISLSLPLHCFPS